MSFHPVSGGHWDLLSFFLGENRDTYLPNSHSPRSWAHLWKHSGVLDPGSRVTFTELRKQIQHPDEACDTRASAWQKYISGVGIYSTSTSTHTPTPMQCLRTGELGLDEVNKVQGFARAATNENPPCSWFAYCNLGEVWSLGNWGPFKQDIYRSFALPNGHQRHQTHGVFTVSILWIITVRSFSFAGYC